MNGINYDEWRHINNQNKARAVQEEFSVDPKTGQNKPKNIKYIKTTTKDMIEDMEKTKPKHTHQFVIPVEQREEKVFKPITQGRFSYTKITVTKLRCSCGEETDRE